MKKGKTKNIALIGLVISTCILTGQQTAYAGMPVFDASNFAQTINQLMEMKKQFEVMQQQYEEAIATTNAVTGSYGMSLIENGPMAKEGRRSLPPTWQEVVSMQKSGKLLGFYSQRQNYFKELLPSIDQTLLSQNPKDRNVVGYELATSNTAASFAATEAIYNRIQDRLKTIETLTQEIDKTDNVKNATDLNSRIAAENGFLNIEMARLSSLQLSLQTVMQNTQNQAIANHAEFFGGSIK